MKEFLFGFWLGCLIGLSLIFSFFFYEEPEPEQKQTQASGQWIGWKNKHNHKPWE